MAVRVETRRAEASGRAAAPLAVGWNSSESRDEGPICHRYPFPVPQYLVGGPTRSALLEGWRVHALCPTKHDRCVVPCRHLARDGIVPAAKRATAASRYLCLTHRAFGAAEDGRIVLQQLLQRKGPVARNRVAGDVHGAIGEAMFLLVLRDWLIWLELREAATSRGAL